MSALFAGDRLSDEQKRAVAEKTAEWIGLSADYILKSNLRVSMDHFGKELLRGEGKVIGRFDARFIGPDKNGAGESPSYDPSDSEISGVFASALNDYQNGKEFCLWKIEKEIYRLNFVLRKKNAL